MNPPRYPGFSGTVTQVVLQRRERAGEADELHQGPVHHRRQVRPDDARPAPGGKDPAHDEADEQQMDGNYEVSGNAEPHLVTRDGITQDRPTSADAAGRAATLLFRGHILGAASRVAARAVGKRGGWPIP